VAGTAGIVLDLLAKAGHHRYGPHRQNRADLYVPRDGDRPHPVVVLVHGGYWRARYGKIVMKPLAADLVRRGYAVWNIEYRRIGRRQGGGYPTTFADVADAIGHLATLDDARLALLVHGSDDATIPVGRTREYVEAARAAGDDVTLIEPHLGGHRSHIDPRSSAWRAAIDWLDDKRTQPEDAVPGTGSSGTGDRFRR
jgi:acetyl esterase/lipase